MIERVRNRIVDNSLVGSLLLWWPCTAGPPAPLRYVPDSLSPTASSKLNSPSGT